MTALGLLSRFGLSRNAAAPPAHPFIAAVLAHSPLVYWRLGESAGGTALDASGNNRHGTYVGAPTLGTTGLLHASADTAVTFDGSDDHVTASNAAWMNDRTYHTSIALITTNTLTGQHSIAGKWDDASYPANIEWLLDMTANGFRMLIEGAFATAGGTYTTGRTYFVAGRRDDRQAAVRVYNSNGLAGYGEALTFTSFPSKNQPLRVGYAGNAGYWDGIIDEFAWFPSALSNADLDTLAGLALTGTPFT